MSKGRAIGEMPNICRKQRDAGGIERVTGLTARQVRGHRGKARLRAPDAPLPRMGDPSAKK